MIMPCMNSTSACESGGSVAFVEGGSVLLGSPGAPGCTTTGLPESFCCSDIAEDKTQARPRSTRQANGMVTFTAGLQDRPGTPEIAMPGADARMRGAVIWNWKLRRRPGLAQTPDTCAIKRS